MTGTTFAVTVEIGAPTGTISITDGAGKKGYT